MADSTDKVKVTQEIIGRSIIPFTGPFFCIYAFFWPESFANWWGTIVGTIIGIIRAKGGF